MMPARFTLLAAALIVSLSACSAEHWTPPPTSQNWAPSDGPLKGPQGTREALLVFDAVMPEITGAVVTFTSSPIIDGDKFLAARIDSLDPVALTVVTQGGGVLDTALVYIAGRAYWLKVKGFEGEGTPEFDAWVTDTTALIEARIHP